jgi:hypothetical protein
LSNIPISRGGPTSLVIYDIHALQVCAFNTFKESYIIGFLYLRFLCSTKEKDPYEFLSNNTIKLMNFSL